MDDPTFPIGRAFQIPAGLKLKDTSVNVLDIHATLQAFLMAVAPIHLRLFNAVLVVTSGRDGNHVASSKHGRGDALDLRINDLPAQYQPAFLLVLRVLCARFALAMFDETYAPGMGHVHIEIAG